MEAQNAQIRLMEATRYALRHGGTIRDCISLVEAVASEDEFAMPSARLRHGQAQYITWVARDIGYGIEDGEGDYIYLGIASGKRALMPVNGGDTIYLFDDEIRNVEEMDAATMLEP